MVSILENMAKQINATIIKFDKEVRAIPEYRDRIKFFVHDKSLVDHNSVETTADLAPEVIFERVNIRYRDRKTGKYKFEAYFVNEENVELVMPVLRTLVQIKTKELNDDLEISNNKLRNEYIEHGKTLKKLQTLENYWFNKLWKFILETRDKLAKKKKRHA